MKRLLFPLCMFVLFLFCITHPKEAIPGASAGLSLWYYTVLPTLLPCMILSGYLISTGLVRRLPPGPFAFLVGWFCGYPMGAKTVSDLYRQGRITKEYGDLLLILCCQPSPMFLTGFLCTGMLHLPAGHMLPCILAVYLPSVFCFGISLLNQKRKVPSGGNDGMPVPEETGGFLASFLQFEEAMMHGFFIIVKVGGYLMLFTMLSYFFRNRCSVPVLSVCIPGILEMTSGIAFTVQEGLPRALTVSLCFAYGAFGGLSGLAQTASVLGETPLSKGKVCFWKALQAAMTFLLLFALYPLL